MFQQASKVKWRPQLKDYFSHWMDKINYEATLKRDKRTLCGVEASGAQHSTFFLLVFFYKWERKHAWLIDACLLSIIASTCFICELIKLIKRFQGIHSCLSPVEIPDLNPPNAFKLPGVSVPHTFGCPIQRTLLALRIPRGHPWYGMGIFWNDPMTNNFCSLAQSLIFSFHLTHVNSRNQGICTELKFPTNALLTFLT